MEPQGSASEVSKQDVLRIFTQSTHPLRARTTAELADALDCTRDAARPALQALVDEGYLYRKEIDDSTVIWGPDNLGTLVESKVEGQFIRDQFTAFIEAVEDYAIFLLDPDGTIVTWNHGAERIKGYTEADILGEHFSTFYTQDAIDDGIPERNLQAAAEEGSVVDEGWRVRADGSRFWANVTITAIRDAAGALEGFVKVTRDMTERREYEQHLKDQAAWLERQRDELEQELDEVFERVDDAFYALDDELQITYINDTAADYLGKPAGELLGRVVWKALDVDEDDPIIEQLRAAMSTQDRTSFERYSEPLGMWVIVRIYPSETGLSVYFRDVTERKERERELQRVRDRMEFALESTDAIVWDWNVDADQAAFYPSEQSLYGTTVENWEDFNEVVHPEDRQRVQEGIEQALKTGEPKHEEVRIVRPDGEIRWVEAPGQPIPGDEDGTPTRMVGIVRDITERKERERELHRSETIIEASTDVNAILDVDGTIRYVTPSVKHVLGYPPEDLEGKDAFEYMHPADRDKMVVELDRLANDDPSPSPGEFRFRHADGSWAWLEVRGRNLLDDPDINGIVVYTREITDRKQYEQELNETVDKLAESNERLEQFAYVASHDLQEPLRMITSYLNLLEERYGDALDEQAHQFIDYVVDGSERMRAMVQDLLRYSRLDTDAKPLEPTDASAVVESALENLQVRIEDSQADISVGELPMVEADANQLEQVFQNLISNAIKYQDDDPPRIEIGAARDDGLVRFHVADNGIGMDSAYTDQIFEVFKRLHTDDEYPGTGIGLALCQRIVTRHGGDIWVESEPGEGATFYFTIHGVE